MYGNDSHTGGESFSMDEDQFESFRRAVSAVGSQTSDHLTHDFNITSQVTETGGSRLGVVFVQYPGAGHLQFTISPEEDMFVEEGPVNPDRIDEITDDILTAVVSQFLAKTPIEYAPAR